MFWEVEILAKAAKAIAIIIGLVVAIVTMLFGLFLILTVLPFGAIMLDPDGRIFFACGLIFFFLTVKTLKSYWDQGHPSYWIFVGHLTIMMFGIVYFDWKYISYILVIFVYLLPLVFDKWYTKKT